jgi:hypothetical protein
MLLWTYERGSLNAACAVSQKSQTMYAAFVVETHGDTMRKCPKFVLFHNGFFWPTGPQLRADEPNTDTYRAGTLLEALADGENITRQHILDWLSAFSTRSSSSVIIMQGGRTLLVRGQRPLYYAHVGNGSVVNTSETVLQALKGMSEQILGFPVGQIRAIPEDTLTLMSPGERISQHYKLRYQYWPHLSAVQTRVEGDYEVVVIDGEIPEHSSYGKAVTSIVARTAEDVNASAFIKIYFKPICKSS